MKLRASSSRELLQVLCVLALGGLAGVVYNPRRERGAAALFAAQASLASRRGSPAVAGSAGALRWALGANVCVDLVARWDAPVAAAERLAADESAAGGGGGDGDASTLASAGAVVSAFSRFFAAGAAAERAAAPAVFDALAAAAAASPGARRSLGGNAGLMAAALARGGAAADSLLLGGAAGPAALALLPAGVRLAGGGGGGGAAAAAGDDVHLILEYSAGEAGPAPARAAAPRANRFILTAAGERDAAPLVALIRAADADAVDVLVVAGLHMLEPLPRAPRARALAAVAAALRARATPSSVHIELASCADADFVRDAADALFPLADSVGFNEQEAAGLHAALGGSWGAGGRAAVDGPAPAAAAVADLLRSLFERFPALSRLHFHSLPFHVLAYAGKAAAPAAAPGAAGGGLKRWRATAAVAAAGAATATREACQLPAGAPAVPASAVHLATGLDIDIRDPRAPAAAAGDAAGDAAGAAAPWWDFAALRARAASLAAAPPSPVTPHSAFSLSSLAPAAEWTWAASDAAGGAVRFLLAPVAVCNAPPSTVGLGDAISAAGLLFDALSLAEVERAALAADADALEEKWRLLRLARRLQRAALAVAAEAQRLWEDGF